MRFCKYCEHLGPGFTCHHPQNIRGHDVVTGTPEFHARTARACREDEDGCGFEGRWFEEVKQNILVGMTVFFLFVFVAFGVLFLWAWWWV